MGEEGYSSPNPFCADGPRQDEFLAEMRREVFDGRDGFLTVGEAPGITPVRNEHITNPANGELDMLFLFDHVDFDCDGVKWKPLPLDLPGFKRIMAGYQTAVENVAGQACSLVTTISHVWSLVGAMTPRRNPACARPKRLADVAHASRHSVRISG